MRELHSTHGTDTVSMSRERTLGIFPFSLYTIFHFNYRGVLCIHR